MTDNADHKVMSGVAPMPAVLQLQLRILTNVFTVTLVQQRALLRLNPLLRPFVV